MGRFLQVVGPLLTIGAILRAFATNAHFPVTQIAVALLYLVIAPLLVYGMHTPSCSLQRRKFLQLLLLLACAALQWCAPVVETVELYAWALACIAMDGLTRRGTVLSTATAGATMLTLELLQGEVPLQPFSVLSNIIWIAAIFGSITVFVSYLSNAQHQARRQAEENLLLYEKLQQAYQTLQREHRQAQAAALQDPLTGVYNRAYLNETLEEQLRACLPQGRPFSLLMIDVDHFKEFNDHFGHLAGDHMLQELSQIFLAAVRETDAVIRYGGEEFCIALPGADLHTAQEVAHRLRENVATHPPRSVRVLTRENEAPVFLTISIGLAVAPIHGTALPELLAAADQALYQAKSARNQVIVAPLPT
ncbi:MAG: GGDEF domain-containing protein [Firmicutes bacterium]|nr:GGDEF domain-containing protein [Bacillota bacterium]